MNYSSKQLIKILLNDGWQLVRTVGSHQHFTHKVKAGIVTVPHPRKDLPIGTVKSIAKQAGIKLV